MILTFFAPRYSGNRHASSNGPAPGFQRPRFGQFHFHDGEKSDQPPRHEYQGYHSYNGSTLPSILYASPDGLRPRGSARKVLPLSFVSREQNQAGCAFSRPARPVLRPTVHPVSDEKAYRNRQSAQCRNKHHLRLHRHNYYLVVFRSA